MLQAEKLAYGVFAMAIGVGGKIIWDWLQNLRKPTVEELRAELKLQRDVNDMDRRVTKIETDLKTMVSAEVFAVYVNDITVIRDTLDEINRELRGGA